MKKLAFYRKKYHFVLLKMLCWTRWIIMSHGHKRSKTSFGGKGEFCWKDFRHIQGDGDSWVPLCSHETKCKRNAAVQVHLASPLFLRSVSWHTMRATSHSCLSLSKSKRSDVVPRWPTVWPKVDPWQLENPAVPSTDPTSTPRARLSYPTAHAFTGPPTVLWPQTKSGLQHDKAQPNICIVELLPTTTCIEGFRLVLNSSKQPPKIFRGLSRCSCISTVDTTVVASPVHLFQFLAPKAVRKFSVHSDFNFFSIPVNKQRRQLILINTLILILVVLFMMELGDEACI